MSSMSSVAILALVGCFLAVGSVRAGLFDGCLGLPGIKSYASAYDYINRALDSKCSTGDSIAMQMDMVHELLDIEDSTSCNRRALVQILNLKSAVSELRCSSESVKILSDNILATRNGALLPQPTRRIDIIVQYHIELHAKLCREEYVTKLRSILEVADEGQIKLVDGYCNRVIDKLWTDRPWTEPRPDVGIGQFRLSEIEMAGMTLKYLKGIVNPEEQAILDSDSDLSKIRRKPMIGEVIRKYMLEPCKYYLRILNTEVFEPYEFDFPEDNNTLAEGEMDFFKALANRRICRALVKDEFKILHHKLYRGITGE